MRRTIVAALTIDEEAFYALYNGLALRKHTHNAANASLVRNSAVPLQKGCAEEKKLSAGHLMMRIRREAAPVLSVRHSAVDVLHQQIELVVVQAVDDCLNVGLLDGGKDR